MKQYNLGVVVGRFQVDELHKAHAALINRALDECDHVLIFVGTTIVRDSKKNPLDFLSRVYMIKNQCPYAPLSIVPIADVPSAKDWDAVLDKKIGEYATGTVQLYSGRDGFHAGYFGKYKHNVTVIDEISDMAGTVVRTQIGKTPLHSCDFRKGVIYAKMNQYPAVYPTVDIAVLKKEDPKGLYTHVALGKKPGETSWRFPGGFADPTDANFNTAAKREAREELGVNLEISTPEYVTNAKIDDWRYRNEENKIITSFFKADHLWGFLSAGDDLEKAEFIKLDDIFTYIEKDVDGEYDDVVQLINKGHIHLMKILFENLIKNGQYIPPARNSK
jgi:bifunctional NMN adenylyltransferase/nudix hydrolase